MRTSRLRKRRVRVDILNLPTDNTDGVKQNKDHVDNIDDDDYDDDSLISADDAWEQLLPSQHSTERKPRPEAPTQQWNALQQHFQQRQHILKHISMPPALKQLLQEHEQQVRHLTEQHVQLQQTHSMHWRQYLYDTAVWEWHSTLPAVVSFVWHTLAHIGIYETLYAVVNLVQYKIHSGTSNTPTDILYGAIFVMGMIGIRWSGSLYWWLADDRHNAVKFELHNRLRLRFNDALILQWMNQHAVIQCTAYMVGYCLCYMAVQYAHYRLGQVLWQHHRDVLLQQLPKRVLATAVCYEDSVLLGDTCLVDGDGYYNYDEPSFGTANDGFVWLPLSYHSYYAHWMQQIVDRSADSPSLLSPNVELVLYPATVIVSLLILTKGCGFVFWKKY